MAKYMNASPEQMLKIAEDFDLKETIESDITRIQTLLNFMMRHDLGYDDGRERKMHAEGCTVYGIVQLGYIEDLLQK
eukprot:scaffold8743_cov174-Ochromonas_danica.AAC.2